MDMHQKIREDARLIMLKALAGQPNETLNSSLLRQSISAYGGIEQTREWVHGELDWLSEMGAVTLREAGTIKIATLTEKGHRHLRREIAIEGVTRPSRPGA